MTATNIFYNFVGFRYSPLNRAMWTKHMFTVCALSLNMGTNWGIKVKRGPVR